MSLEPIVDQWYHYPEKSQKFYVTAVDPHSKTVEIQYFDGTIDEMDWSSWYEQEMEVIEAPQDWTGPMEYLEMDDRSANGTEMSREDWDAPYDEVMEKAHAGPREDEPEFESEIESELEHEFESELESEFEPVSYESDYEK